jgi:hypothetical protein
MLRSQRQASLQARRRVAESIGDEGVAELVHSNAENERDQVENSAPKLVESDVQGVSRLGRNVRV